MAKLWVLVATGFLLAACQRGCHHADATKGHVAEPGLGRGADASPRVEFSIDAVYEHQKPSDAAPWHAAGGDWTFFDAHTDAGTRFGFGWTHPPLRDSMAFGKAIWSVPDPNMGADLVRTFARVFDGNVPPPAQQQLLHPQPFSLACLGDALGRDDAGFSGQGNWHANKLFLQRPGIEAELFFNFDLAEKQGEFAEKDREYTGDLLQFMARELRDGPLSPQTPENDARISLVGPKLGEWRPISPVGATFHGFEARGARVVYSVKDGTGTRLVSVASDGAPAELELMRLEHDFTGMVCAAADDPCLVEQTLHKQPNTFSSDDLNDFFLLQRAQKKVVPLSGPWGKEGSSSQASASPDGKFVVLASLRKRSTGKGSYHVLHFVSVDNPTSVVTFSHEEDWLQVVDWQGTGPGLRAVVRGGLPFDKQQPLTWFLVDPKTAADNDSPAAAVAADKALSPDGKHRYSCNKDQEILITDVAGGAVQHFPVVPRERHALAEECELTWRGPRFLEFSPERTAFIDIDSLKLSFPFEEGAEPEGANYDPTFTWLVATKDSRLAIARITVR
jgi:hypothetical protein